MAISSFIANDREGKSYYFRSYTDVTNVIHTPAVYDRNAWNLIGNTNSSPAQSNMESASINSLLRLGVINVENLFYSLPYRNAGVNSTRVETKVNASDAFSEDLAVDNTDYSSLTVTPYTVSYDVAAFDNLTLEIENTGSNPLSQFWIYGSNFPVIYTSESPIISTSPHYTTNTARALNQPLLPNIDASGNLNNLAAGAIGWVELSVIQYKYLHVKARSSNPTTLKIAAYFT
jgi:hypothetical protein